MPELREVLSEAFEQAEQTSPSPTPSTSVSTDTKTEPLETNEQKQARERDEKGRFSAKSIEKLATSQAVEAPGQAQLQGQSQSTNRPARPTSWKKEMEPYWDTLDPKIAEYLNQREQDYRKGIGQYLPDAEYGRAVRDMLQPYQETIKSLGMDEKTAVTGLLNADYQLRYGSNEQKLQMLNKIINDYRISVNGFQPQPVSPDYQAIRQELNQLRSGFSQYQESQKQAHLSMIEKEIESFREGKEYFEDVQDTMIQILQSGMAQDLPTAYDKAIRLHPDIFDRLTMERLRSDEQKRREEADKAAKAAKAKGVSVKGSTPAKLITNGGAKDRRSIIAEAMEEFESRI